MKGLSIGLVAIALAMSFSAMARPKGFDIWLKADAEIAADGSVKALDWTDDRPAAKLLIAKIEPAILRWMFVPGKVDGRPMQTQTQLSVQVLGEERDDGALEFKFGKASTGAAFKKLGPPKYPTGAAIAGVSAVVVVEVDVDIKGQLAIRSVTFTGSMGDRYRKEFVAATELAIKTWTMQPERVAGLPAPAHMSIPIDFCIGAWCDRRARAEQHLQRRGEGGEGGERGAPVALDSVVRLVTHVEGQEI
ncbi:MAG TPA: TonB family protein [Lysobacter sp.]|nr:TonB family protein [Lysobacter sp.]